MRALGQQGSGEPGSRVAPTVSPASAISGLKDPNRPWT